MLNGKVAVVVCLLLLSRPAFATTITAEAGEWGRWTINTLSNIGETRRVLQSFTRCPEFPSWCNSFFDGKMESLSFKTPLGIQTISEPYIVLWVVPSPEGTLVLQKEDIDNRLLSTIRKNGLYCPVFVFKYDFPDMDKNDLYVRFKALSIQRIKETFPYTKVEKDWVYDTVFPDIDILSDMAAITGEFFSR